MTESSSHFQIKAEATATLKVRVNLALHHLFAACRFAVRVAQLEQENTGRPFGGFWEEILHNCLGVATLTVASLESYANELYFEGSIVTPTLNSAAAAELADVIDREPILQKYSMAFAVRTGTRLDHSVTPVQNAHALIKLRNAVVHFRPEWSDEKDKHDRLSKVLRYKFKPSAFFPNEPIFPLAWASHDFVTWALRTTVQFLDYFYCAVAVPSPIDGFKPQLRELSGNVI
jgi:hypothetical protein